jgi:hypothetical protein
MNKRPRSRLANRLKPSLRNSSSPPLREEELDDLIRLMNVRKQVQREEAELEVLLERQELGEDVDTDRLYRLELLGRQRMGEILDDEEQALLYYMELDQQDDKEFVELKQQKENGQDIDEARFYELELLSRKLHGDTAMTDEEIRDVELLLRRREDARVDQRDYRVMLQLLEDGEAIDDNRFHILSLLDRQRRFDELTDAEAGEVNQYFDQRDEEHLDSIELSMLLEKQEMGEDVDEERIYELDLMDRLRQGENLTPDEEKDLAVLKTRRELELQQVNELEELIQRKDSGEDVNEDRLYELELLVRLRQGEELSATERENLARLETSRIKQEQEAEEQTRKQIEAEFEEFVVTTPQRRRAG